MFLTLYPGTALDRTVLSQVSNALDVEGLPWDKLSSLISPFGRNNLLKTHFVQQVKEIKQVLKGLFEMKCT